MARTNIKASASKSQLAIATILAVRQNSDLQGKWILDQVIVDVINESQNIDNKISKVELNRAVSNYYKNKADILLLHTSNRTRVTCYFFTRQLNKLPSAPNSSTKIYDTVSSIEQTEVATRARFEVTNQVKEISQSSVSSHVQTNSRALASAYFEKTHNCGIQWFNKSGDAGL